MAEYQLGLSKNFGGKLWTGKDLHPGHQRGPYGDPEDSSFEFTAIVQRALSSQDPWHWRLESHLPRYSGGGADPSDSWVTLGHRFRILKLKNRTPVQCSVDEITTLELSQRAPLSWLPKGEKDDCSCRDQFHAWVRGEWRCLGQRTVVT